MPGIFLLTCSDSDQAPQISSAKLTSPASSYSHSQMQLNVAVKLLEKTKASVVTYRESGLVATQPQQKKCAEAVLKEKRLKNIKKFDCIAADEPITDTMKRLEITLYRSLNELIITPWEVR